MDTVKHLQSQLRDKFDYNYMTGDFIRTKKTSPRSKLGVVGSKGAGGYLRVSFLGELQYVQRLIWVWLYGEWPDEIDHINHDKADNRRSNIRNVNRLENCRNLPLSKNNTSGVVGVGFFYGAYRATIKVKGKTIYLGFFKDKSTAIKIRRKAEIEYGFHPNHGSRTDE